MVKKFVFVISLCMVLACCGCGDESDLRKVDADRAETYEETAYGDTTGTHEETEYEDSVETAENVKAFFESVTDEMLNDCDDYPSLEEYRNAPLVLLERFQDVGLYGIRAGEETAMLLYIEGEKILIEEDPFPSFLNLYQERPKLNVFDADRDGVNEVMISLRTVTGTPISRYAMLVCDREDEWNIYMYDDYLEDMEDVIQYKYDDKNNVIAFLDDGGNVLWEEELPEWTGEYPYTGVVDFGDNVNFDAGTVQMNVVPYIELENSLPYEPIRIVFDISFSDETFEIEGYEIQKNDPQTDIYIRDYVALEDDEEIEGCEWMQYDRNPVLRVKIRYKEKPENAYQHKKDYFLFLTRDDEISRVLVTDYEDKGIHIRLNEGTACENNHSLGEGCGFDAHFEDVTFDGRKDLIISVGNSRHASYYCAYICMDDGFRHEKTFEHIPSYEVKNEERVICGSDTDGISWYADMTYEYKDGEFVLTDYVEKEIKEE